MTTKKNSLDDLRAEESKIKLKELYDLFNNKYNHIEINPNYTLNLIKLLYLNIITYKPIIIYDDENIRLLTGIKQVCAICRFFEMDQYQCLTRSKQRYFENFEITIIKILPPINKKNIDYIFNKIKLL